MSYTGATKIRPVEREDLRELARLERLAKAYTDPDFGELIKPWAWTRRDFLEAARCELCRSYLVEQEGEVAAALVYSLRPQSYEALLITAHPLAPERVEDLAWFLEAKVSNSPKRKAAYYDCPDGEDGVLRALVRRGWRAKRLPRAFDPADGWRLSFKRKS